MIQRFLLLSAFALFSSIIEDAPKSLAATNDPASFVSDLASRALAPMPNADTTAARQERFASCSVSISTWNPAPVPLSGHIG